MLLGYKKDRSSPDYLLMRQTMGSEVRLPRLKVSVLPLISCVTSGNLLTVPQFPHHKMGTKIALIIDYYD